MAVVNQVALARLSFACPVDELHIGDYTGKLTEAA